MDDGVPGAGPSCSADHNVSWARAEFQHSWPCDTYRDAAVGLGVKFGAWVVALSESPSACDPGPPAAKEASMDSRQTDALINVIRSISHGGTNGPTGLEMLSMSISGDGNGMPLARAIDNAGTDINAGLTAVAEAISELAAVLASRPAPTTGAATYPSSEAEVSPPFQPDTYYDHGLHPGNVNSPE